MHLTVICLVVASAVCQLGQISWSVPKINSTLIPTTNSCYSVGINFIVHRTYRSTVLRSILFAAQKNSLFQYKRNTRFMHLTVICLVVASTVCQLGLFLRSALTINFTLIRVYLLVLIFWFVTLAVRLSLVQFYVAQNLFALIQTANSINAVICVVVASTVCQLGQFLWSGPKINFTLIQPQTPVMLLALIIWFVVLAVQR